MPVQVRDGVTEHLVVHLARVKGGGVLVGREDGNRRRQVADLAEHVPGGARRTRLGMLERRDDRGERASCLGHRRRPIVRGGYLALAAQSAWYSMPSGFISADFSAQAAFCFSGPRRSLILSRSLAAESSASFGDFRLARASVISNESLRWYSSAAGMTGSGTRYGKLAWMASRYLSASGNSLRNF